MTTPRFYLPQPLEQDSCITLPQDVAHRVRSVLRLRCHDDLIVFNGDGGEFMARIASIDKKSVLVDVLTWQQGIAKSPLTILLAQCIARGEKMDYIVQKAVELGVTFITPVISEFCNVRLDNERLQQRLQHWQKVAIHASEQCGRCDVPPILPATKLMSWLSTPILDYSRIVLSPVDGGANCGVSFHPEQGVPQRIALLVGSEGGLSSAEIEMAQTQGFSPCRLGPRILRTETAALVAISILQAYCGDLQ